MINGEEGGKIKKPHSDRKWTLLPRGLVNVFLYPLDQYILYLAFKSFTPYHSICSLFKLSIIFTFYLKKLIVPYMFYICSMFSSFWLKHSDFLLLLFDSMFIILFLTEKISLFLSIVSFLFIGSKYLTISSFVYSISFTLLFLLLVKYSKAFFFNWRLNYLQILGWLALRSPVTPTWFIKLKIEKFSY